MTAALSRALIALAAGCLGEARREWARAMQAEFEAAMRDGKSLSFAAGCLLAALRELPAHEEGRFSLASHFLAFAIMVPTAALLVSGISGEIPFLQLRQIVPANGVLLSDANLSAIPPLAALVAWMAAIQLRLAWLVLERDWSGVAAAGMLIAASTMALLVFTAVVFLHYGSVLLLAGALAVELAGVSALARWHRRFFGGRLEAAA
ncbi:MAG TPA: hypothetical protein VF662_05490 [Allosphingosinicella sp.]|jgi:hypothetical protein